MQAQTMAKVPPSQPSILPPLQNLPSWSRSSLERRKQPRPIVRDPPPVMGVDQAFEMAEDHSTNLSSGNEPRIVSAPSRAGEKDLRQKVAEMEKKIFFLQSQHTQVLSNLHEEIELLKAENKDLNFKLVMSRSGVNIEDISPVPSDEQADRSSPKTQLKSSKDKQSSANKKKQVKSNKSLEHENTNKEPKSTVETKQNSRQSSPNIKNSRESSGKKNVTSTPPGSGKKPANSIGSIGSGKSKFLSKARSKQHQKEQPVATTKDGSVETPPQSPIWSSIHGGQQMLMVTLAKDKTIQVHVPTENGPRSPTLAECKTIIVEQQETNHKQARELSKLRTDLREAILSQKWNQNSYLAGRSFGKMDYGSSNINGGNGNSNRHLPQLPVREPVNSGRLPPRAPAQTEKVSLPSLRPNINSGVADRRRRQQAILRGRMGRRDFY